MGGRRLQATGRGWGSPSSWCLGKLTKVVTVVGNSDKGCKSKELIRKKAHGDVRDLISSKRKKKVELPSRVTEASDTAEMLIRGWILAFVKWEPISSLYNQPLTISTLCSKSWVLKWNYGWRNRIPMKVFQKEVSAFSVVENTKPSPAGFVLCFSCRLHCLLSASGCGICCWRGRTGMCRLLEQAPVIVLGPGFYRLLVPVFQLKTCWSKRNIQRLWIICRILFLVLWFFFWYEKIFLKPRSELGDSLLGLVVKSSQDVRLSL